MEKPDAYFLQYTNIKNDCGEDVQDYLKTLPDADFITNNCEFFYFMTGIPCNYLSNDEGDYLPGGSVSQILQDGTILAYVPGFGTQMESLSYLVSNLEPIQNVCSLELYVWPDE
ncbi:hypothetical protein JR338_00245 [Chloroflexota bacterium]|nr:hypothetical protein JR338_00245 [Chloroflexota bacterium]